VIGVVLLILTLAMGFTGYLLPFDQRSGWTTIVGVNINATGPFMADRPRLLVIPQTARARRRPEPLAVSWVSTNERPSGILSRRGVIDPAPCPMRSSAAEI
jgi:hypothetical protein